MKQNDSSKCPPAPPASYRLLEHTADIGVELSATSLDGLYSAAAASLPTLLELAAGKADKTRDIRLSGISRDGMLVDWYNELLYLLEQESFLASQARVEMTGETRLEARVSGRTLKTGESSGREVKAATWHQLELEPVGDGWRARIYLDL